MNFDLPTYRRTQTPCTHTHTLSPCRSHSHAFFCHCCCCCRFFFVMYNFYILRIGHCCHDAVAANFCLGTHTHRGGQTDTQLLSVLCGMARDASDATEFNAQWIRTWEQPLASCDRVQLDRSNKFSCPTVIWAGVERGGRCWVDASHVCLPSCMTYGMGSQQHYPTPLLLSLTHAVPPQRYLALP